MPDKSIQQQIAELFAKLPCNKQFEVLDALCNYVHRFIEDDSKDYLKYLGNLGEEPEEDSDDTAF